MSWVQYTAETEFPVQNLPYAVAYKKGCDAKQAVCVTRIGDYVVDLAGLQAAGLLLSVQTDCFAKPYLNDFMAMGREAWTQCRSQLTALFATGGKADLRENKELQGKVFLNAADAAYLVPCRIGDYTDFYASIGHATNMGKMFRPNEAALKPNWKWMPVGYHGRASSVVVSGTDLKRPRGQIKARTEPKPKYGLCARMDYEIEMAIYVGTGNELGDPVKVEDAPNKIFGVGLMNDWSARDIQVWEYVPLGPFNGKNLGTTVSPWIITLDALQPFLVQGEVQDPAPFPYLAEKVKAHYDINIALAIQTAKMDKPHELSKTNGKYVYWSWNQMMAHHTETGCNLRPGDMYGTGTLSGPTDAEMGSILELSWAGKKPISLPNGETRTFIEDGDTIIITGFCQGDGYRIGFGEARGTILPANPL
mmetsp:Transcript_11013/g.12102  ORF Transcript_11013/g.12102 Transcript_11013/m.12102 type:complete len:420 (+) Transcript_11013:3-1262(+)